MLHRVLNTPLITEHDQRKRQVLSCVIGKWGTHGCDMGPKLPRWAWILLKCLSLEALKKKKRYKKRSDLLKGILFFYQQSFA